MARLRHTGIFQFTFMDAATTFLEAAPHGMALQHHTHDTRAATSVKVTASNATDYSLRNHYTLVSIHPRIWLWTRAKSLPCLSSSTLGRSHQHNQAPHPATRLSCSAATDARRPPTLHHHQHTTALLEFTGLSRHRLATSHHRHTARCPRQFSNTRIDTRSMVYACCHAHHRFCNVAALRNR